MPQFGALRDKQALLCQPPKQVLVVDRDDDRSLYPPSNKRSEAIRPVNKSAPKATIVSAAATSTP